MWFLVFNRRFIQTLTTFAFILAGLLLFLMGNITKTGKAVTLNPPNIPVYLGEPIQWLGIALIFSILIYAIEEGVKTLKDRG